MLWLEAYNTVWSSCLHSAPNNPSCSTPSSLSGWFISSSCLPLFPDLVGNESQFQSLHQDSGFFLPCGQWVSLASGSYLAPGLSLWSALPPLLFLPLYCLFHLPEPSTPHLLSLWKGQIVRTNILQPPVPRAPCLSAPSVLSSHSSWSPCSRVSESSDVFTKSLPDHNTRNYWGLCRYKSRPRK